MCSQQRLNDVEGQSIYVLTGICDHPIGLIAESLCTNFNVLVDGGDGIFGDRRQIYDKGSSRVICFRRIISDWRRW